MKQPRNESRLYSFDVLKSILDASTVDFKNDIWIGVYLWNWAKKTQYLDTFIKGKFVIYLDLKKAF